MKHNLIRATIACILIATVGQYVRAQGTFANLNFENPVLPLVETPPGSGTVPISNALPGWTGYTYNTAPDDQVYYNALTLGSASIDFLGPGSGYPAFEGVYFVRLQMSFDGLTIPALAQTGMVPSDAQSIRFCARSYRMGPVLEFGGQQIGLALLGGSSSTYYVWGGDVSRFAGQRGELRFLGDFALDNIFFSDLPVVPEPGIFGLSALGALVLGSRVWGRRR
jgi:hypothetical protein